MPAERWDHELRSAGFGGIESLAYDGYLNNNIVAMPSTPTETRKKVILLMRGPGLPVNGPVSDLERHIVQSGYHVDRLTLEEFLTRQVPQDLDIVSALELDGPFFKDLEEHKFRLWERFVRKVREEGHGVLWLTQARQVTKYADPEYGMVIGMARMLRNEADLEFATVEMEPLDSSNLECVLNILKVFHSRFTEESVQPTSEWAIVGGRALIGRYQPIRVVQEIRDACSDPTIPDWLTENVYRAEAELQQLGPDDVEIAVKAAGVSFEVSRSILLQTRKPLRPCQTHADVSRTAVDQNPGLSHGHRPWYQGNFYRRFRIRG